MKKTLTTLIGTIALISSAAFAQTTTPSQSGTTGDSSGATGSSRQDTGSGAMGSGSQSQSQQDSSVVPQGFSSLDKDSSGEISRREAASQQSLSRIFDRADENKDGQLSQSEYQDALAPESSSVN
jgi:hypothetical protein